MSLSGSPKSSTECTSERGCDSSSSGVQYIGCPASYDIINGNDPNVVCMIRRKRASNLVVYRARTFPHVNENGSERMCLDPKSPIEIFWLKMSRGDLKKHRDAGKMDDRVELTKVERKVVYGVSCKQITPKKRSSKTSKWKTLKRRISQHRRNSRSASSSNTAACVEDDQKETTDTTHTNNDLSCIAECAGENATGNREGEEVVASDLDNGEPATLYKVVFNVFRSMDAKLSIDAESQTPQLSGNVLLEGEHIECILKEVWVTIKKNKVGLPKIDYLTVKAIRAATREPIEYIINKKKYETLK